MLSSKKVTQVINLFARLSGNKIDKLKVIKLIYFADKYHLRKYGRTITEDLYFAMELGPVQSTVKDIIDNSFCLSDGEKEYRKSYLDKNGHNVISINDVDSKQLSKSDISAITLIWNKLGEYTKKELVDLTHENQEWKQCEDKLSSNSRVQLDIISLFKDSNDFVSDLTKDDVENSKEIYKERLAMEQQLNDCFS